jgi:alpha-L-fucosidase
MADHETSGRETRVGEATTGGASTDQADRESEARGWFDDARFGMFVHWGPYSVRGLEPSWPLVGGSVAFPHGQDVSVEDYYEGTDEWAPPAGFADEWARLAVAAGMRYAVLTTKHHDGFTLFPTTTSPRGVHESAPGRDLVGEFVTAMRGVGLKVGLYFSLPDWGHPDYPAFTDEMRPYPLIAYPRAEPEVWARFIDAQRAQLDHLLTAYGTIDVLWFDGYWERFPDEWQAEELAALIYERQPDILINDRLPGVPGYETPEQTVPAEAPDHRWETCLTMNDSWGNVDADRGWKSPRLLLDTLAGVAGGGGNLLLNVSPDGDGHVPAWQRERLEAIGSWVQRHGEAIFGTDAGLEPWQFTGPSTRSQDGTRTYLFCTMRPQEHVLLRGLHGKRFESVRTLGTDQALDFELRLSALDRIHGGDRPCDVLISVPEDAIDPMITVIEVTERPG